MRVCSHWDTKCSGETKVCELEIVICNAGLQVIVQRRKGWTYWN